MTAGRAPTILDVARRAGVSIGTVSNVLNGTARVSDDRRARVETASRELGFRLNGLAQGLRRRRSGIVGLCVPATASAYFAALAEAFEEVAGGLGLGVMQVLTHGDPAIELERIGALLARRTDGLVLVPSTAPQEALDTIARAGAPTVLVDRMVEDDRFDQVGIDDAGAMREVTRHLLAIGHQRLLFIVRHPELVTTRARIAAFTATTTEACAAGLLMIRNDHEAAFAQQLAARLGGTAAPTAIVASNSIIAQWVLAALRRHGLRWPDDVSVLSFDEPVWGGLVEPALSVVRQPVEAIARTACQLLLDRIDDPAAPTRRVVLPVEVVWRGSCAGRQAEAASRTSTASVR